jgi:hypothetical protein
MSEAGLAVPADVVAPEDPLVTVAHPTVTRATAASTRTDHTACGLTWREITADVYQPPPVGTNSHMAIFTTDRTLVSG